MKNQNTLSYILAFNKEIKDLHRVQPDNEVIAVIDQYVARHNKKCYYQTLDSLGFKLGIEFQCLFLMYEDEEKIEYKAAIKFKAGNPLNDITHEQLLRYDPFTSMDKCYAFLASQYIYTLMRVHHLERYVLNDQALEE